ncbi:MAG: hypothetical protein RLZZ301_459 [Bacteroidota bacterium]|jgi:signal transduction histidine kinase
MKSLKTFLLHTKYFLLAFVCFAISTFIFVNEESHLHVGQLERQFQVLEAQSESYASAVLSALEKKKTLPESAQLEYHLYEGERLIGWSSNQLPVGRFKSIDFPTSGLVKLQNGWYFCHIKRAGPLLCCVSFCLENSYDYSNDFLRDCNPNFWKQEFQVSVNGPENLGVHQQNGRIVFYATERSNASTTAFADAVLVFLFGFTFLLFGSYQVVQGNVLASIFYVLVLLVLRIFFFELPWPKTIESSDWFSASFFAYNEWFPNFFELLVNGIFIAFCVFILMKLFNKVSRPLIQLLLFVIPMLLWVGILKLLEIVVRHSNMPLNFNRFFEFGISSFAFFGFLGFLFLSYQRILYNQLSRIHMLPSQWRKASLIVVGIGHVWLSFAFESALFLAPLVIVALNYPLLQKAHTSIYKVSAQLLSLSVYACVSMFQLQWLQTEKEHSNKIAYALQLSNERNINLELDYAQIAPKLQEEHWLTTHPDTLAIQMSKSSFEHILMQRYFHGVWDAYDLNADVFSETGYGYFSQDSSALKNLKLLVREHGQVSDIQNGIYYMPHEEEGLSYVFLLPLKPASILAISLVSKRIPEEIGFPRLLISDQAAVSSNLEHYAIGKYADGRLIHQTGDYNYPNVLSAFHFGKKQIITFGKQGYQHTCYQHSPGNAILISSLDEGWFPLLTNFAYIFTYWGFLLMLLNTINGSLWKDGYQWTLAFRIQVAFLSVLILSLVLYGIGSSLFIGKQYESFAKQALRDKLNSVELELKPAVSNLDSLRVSNQNQGLEKQLKALSSVFQTDLILYDNNGFLVASSRPKLFAHGLIGEHMNANAMDAFLLRQNSYFTHQDQIGSLHYNSAYLPLYNSKLKLIGYINLQQFGQQEAYEQQIESFLKSIINVFILLLAVSVLMALVITNWLIGPLQTLTRSLKGIQFGKINKRIHYTQQDEIGAIVQAYNDKLVELDKAAQRLALSERESAWRELAQQIAHEIKNPLTPMKLSIQHLLRTYDPTDAQSSEHVEKVLHSVIEQIEGLTKMANEFAQFAKLPAAQLEKIDLPDLINNVIAIYQEESQIYFESQVTQRFISGDKSMLTQVLNNLFTNAIQAIKAQGVEGHIQVTLLQGKTSFRLSIEDNGIGISDEVKERIFTPYFTTKSSGSGIGLSVVKQLIEKHNGTIVFHSKKGVGTTFIIELPLLSETR